MFPSFLFHSIPKHLLIPILQLADDMSKCGALALENDERQAGCESLPPQVFGASIVPSGHCTLQQVPPDLLLLLEAVSAAFLSER